MPIYIRTLLSSWGYSINYLGNNFDHPHLAIHALNDWRESWAWQKNPRNFQVVKATFIRNSMGFLAGSKYSVINYKGILCQERENGSWIAKRDLIVG